MSILMQFENMMLYLFISMGVIIIFFAVLYFFVSQKLESEGEQKQYFRLMVIAAVLIWGILIATTLFYPDFFVGTNWFIYIYAICTTLAAFGIYFFITSLIKIDTRFKKFYVNEDAWFNPDVAKWGDMSIIKQNYPPENVLKEIGDWACLAPREILDKKWFDEFYEFVQKNDAESIVELIEQGNQSKLKRPAKDALIRVFGYIKKPSQQTSITKARYEKLKANEIIEDLKKIQKPETEIHDRKYIFACRFIYWESEQLQTKASEWLGRLKWLGWIVFIGVFIVFLDYNAAFPNGSSTFQFFSGEGFSNIGALILAEDVVPLLLIFYKTAAFSSMFMIGVYAGISAMVLMSFREIGVNLKFPLPNYRSGDPFIEELGNFAITISLITAVIYGLNLPFMFNFLVTANPYLFYVLLGVTSLFVFMIFLLTVYGPHRTMVHTKKIWTTKLRSLLDDENLYTNKAGEIDTGRYKKYKKTYEEVLNLREWALAPPVLIKLVSSILIPIFIFVITQLLGNYL